MCSGVEWVNGCRAFGSSSLNLPSGWGNEWAGDIVSGAGDNLDNAALYGYGGTGKCYNTHAAMRISNSYNYPLGTALLI